jgi:hypothetical protein
MVSSSSELSAPADTLVAEGTARNIPLFFEGFVRTTMFGAILSLILVGPVLIAVELAVHSNFSTPMILSTIGGVFNVAFMLCAIMYRRRWRQIGSRVRVYPDRLVFVRRGNAVDLFWDEIRAFYCRARNEHQTVTGLDQTYLGTRWKYRFVHLDGRQAEFGEILVERFFMS